MELGELRSLAALAGLGSIARTEEKLHLSVLDITLPLSKRLTGGYSNHLSGAPS